ncbi:glycosyltransferase family 25 protein [Pseudomonadota bacterium]
MFIFMIVWTTGKRSCEQDKNRATLHQKLFADEDMSQFGKALDLFDSILVVTLKGQHERQDQAAKALETYGVPFQFFYGADYRDRSVKELVTEQIYDPTYKEKNGKLSLTSGEIGCAASHRTLAEKIVEGHHNTVLVLEDDLIVLGDNIGAFVESRSTLPKSWNLLYLGYNKNNVSIPLSIRLKLASWYRLRFWFGSKRHDPSTIRRIFRRPYNSNWFHAGCFNGTHAYAIDRSAAKYLVNLQTPVKLEADMALQHLVRFSGLNAYCPKYDVFDQRWDIPSLVGARESWH